MAWQDIGAGWSGPLFFIPCARHKNNYLVVIIICINNTTNPLIKSIPIPGITQKISLLQNKMSTYPTGPLGGPLEKVKFGTYLFSMNNL